MPLSEHQQRLLEQLERALQDEDPKFASALQGSRLRGRLRLRLVLAGLGVLLGWPRSATGSLSAHQLGIEILGAVVALGCGWLAWNAWRHLPAPGEIAPAARVKAARRSSVGHGTFMQRMELRWQHRRERDGF